MTFVVRHLKDERDVVHAVPQSQWSETWGRAKCDEVYSRVYNINGSFMRLVEEPVSCLLCIAEGL